jgi:hypothetical protein
MIDDICTRITLTDCVLASGLFCGKLRSCSSLPLGQLRKPEPKAERAGLWRIHTLNVSRHVRGKMTWVASQPLTSKGSASCRELVTFTL